MADEVLQQELTPYLEELEQEDEEEDSEKGHVDIQHGREAATSGSSSKDDTAPLRKCHVIDFLGSYHYRDKVKMDKPCKRAAPPC